MITMEAVDAMAARLGLMPRDLCAQLCRGQDWRWDALDKGNFPRHELRCRQTGRTTTMILQMLCWLEENPTEKAYVVGCDQEQTENIRKSAAEYAEKLGLDKDRIKAISQRSKSSSLIGVAPEAVFRDHNA